MKLYDTVITIKPIKDSKHEIGLNKIGTIIEINNLENKTYYIIEFENGIIMYQVPADAIKIHN